MERNGCARRSPSPATGRPDLISIHGRRLEYEYSHTEAEAVIVFLHEGLGSASTWRDFPARLAQVTGCGTLVYSRCGHGRSDPPVTPRTPRFMHDEATLTLPALLNELDVREPLLLGHSEGASIALLHAALVGGVRGVVAMAPHVMVEERNLESIRRTKASFESTDLRDRLARHHASPAATFRAWNDSWLSPQFRGWSIEECLPRIACPVLAIRGEDDEYGSMTQLERIARAVPRVEVLRLANCGHAPQRDQPEAVLAAVAALAKRVTADSRD